MPNIRSAAKAMRSSAKKRMRNRSVKSALKSALSKAERLIAQDLAGEAGPASLKAVSALDKAAQKDITHPNTAARHKSRLMKRLNNAVKAAAAVIEAEAAKPKRRAPRKAAPAAAPPGAEAAKPKARAPRKGAAAVALPEAEAAKPKARAPRKAPSKA